MSRRPRAHDRVRASAVLHHVLAVAVLAASFGTGACQREEPKVAVPLQIPDDRAALEFMARFFKSYVNIDVDACMEMLCSTDDETAAHVRAFIHATQKPTSPFRVNEFQVRSVELMWLNREPMHRVEVSFPRRNGSGQILHVYAVRAREGCLEGFLDPPAAGEMMPRASEDSAENAPPSSTNERLSPDRDGPPRASDGDGAPPSPPPPFSSPNERDGAPREDIIEL
jgi:hypothetical protein